MSTIIVKIDEVQPQGYPVSLHAEQDGADWLRTPRASSFMPCPLKPEGAATALTVAALKDVLNVDGASDRLVEVGRYLSDLLFGGEVGAAFRSLRAGRTRLTVFDIVPLELRWLPWELLTAPGEKSRHLFLDPSRPCVRGRSANLSCPAPPYEWPLRALIVIGSPPGDDVIKQADAREEVVAILRGLRRLGRTAEAEVLWHPSKKRLLDSYREFKPHIFHFIGHGGADTPAGAVKSRPYLEFFDKEAGLPWEWSVKDIGDDLSGLHPATFAFINACRTDQTAAGQVLTPDENLTIAETFANTCIPAVLGMTANVRTDVALEVAGGLYRAVGEGKPLDLAISEARKSVNSMTGLGVSHRHWAVASLTVSAHPDTLLAVKPALNPARQRQFRQDGILQSLSSFVDRQDQRRSLVKIDPYFEADNYQSLLLVRGGPGFGKTALVQLFLECCAMRGRKLLWVDMSGPTLNFAQALCRISAGDPKAKTVLGEPLEPRSAFNKFHFELPYLLKGKLPPDLPEWKKGYVEKEPKAKLLQGADKHKLGKHLDRIFSNFADALREVAGGRPLVIALDQLNIDARDFEDYLVPRLLRPIKNHELAPVRVILVLSEGDITRYNLNREREPPLYIGDAIRLPPFGKDEFETLAYEFLRHKLSESTFKEETHRTLAETETRRYSDLPGLEGGWSPAMLGLMWQIMNQGKVPA